MKRDGPPAWGLSGEITTSHYKNKHVTKYYTGLRTCTDSMIEYEGVGWIHLFE